MVFPQGTPETSRRAVFRIQAGGAEAKVWAGLGDGPELVDLHDISAAGCGFSVPKKAAKRVRVGDALALRMQIGGSDLPVVRTRATVRNINKVKGQIRLGLAYIDTERLYQQLRGIQWSFFNRRGAYRLRMLDEDARPLRATLEAGAALAPEGFEVFDLSSTGLCFTVDNETQGAVPKGVPVKCTLAVPGLSDETEMILHVVHVLDRGAVQRFGCSIDRDATQGGAELSEALSRYVIERQAEMRSV